MAVSRKKICVTKFLLYRMFDRSNMAIQTWLFDKPFIKTKWSEPVTCVKTIIFVTNDKIQTFTGKLEFWYSCIFSHKLEAWILKDSSDKIISDNWQMSFEYCVMKSVCLEDLHNSVNQHSLNFWWLLQKSYIGERSIRCTR